MKIKTITDEELLDLILAGRIVVKYRNRRNPTILLDKKVRKPSLVPGRNNPRYRIEIELPKKPRQQKRRKRTIVRSKIVWMFTHKRVVPDGHELHHVDEDRLNDRARNIINWTEQAHRDYHNGVPF